MANFATRTWESVESLLRGTGDSHLTVVNDSSSTAPWFQISDSSGPFATQFGYGLNINAAIDPNTSLLLPSAIAGLWTKLPMAAVDTAGGVVSWANPIGATIMVTRVFVNSTHVSTGACTLDVGIAANGTTLSDTLVDGIDMTTTAPALFDNMLAATAGTNGKPSQLMTSGQFLTASTASGASAGLVGNLYVQWIPL